MYLHKQADKQAAERLLQHKRVALRQATETYDAIRAGKAGMNFHKFPFVYSSLFPYQRLMTNTMARTLQEQSSQILLLAGRSVDSTLQTEMSGLSAKLASCDAHLETVWSDRKRAEAALTEAELQLDRCLSADNNSLD